VQEAMACGLPVVCGGETALADPGAARWLRGIEIALADPDGTALRALGAIETLDNDAEARARMSDYAARTYDWRATASRIIAALRTA
jgi:starch synthase